MNPAARETNTHFSFDAISGQPATMKSRTHALHGARSSLEKIATKVGETHATGAPMQRHRCDRAHPRRRGPSRTSRVIGKERIPRS